MNETDMDRLLDYHRHRWWFVNGWSIRFQVRRAEVTEGKPHGIKYSFTLHDVDGTRILAFDNAHSIPMRTEHDHWHKFRNMGKRVPYAFIDGDTLLADFITAVRKACAAEGVVYDIDDQDRVGEEDDDDEENS